MKMFIANCTKQAHEFRYWVPGKKEPVVQKIPQGMQISIECERSLADSIIKAHKPYGFTPRDEIASTKRFHGIAYQFDKPIDVDSIYLGIEANVDNALIRANEVRQVTAQAVAEKAVETATELNHKLGGEGEVSVGDVVVELTETSERPDNRPRFKQTLTALTPERGGERRKAGKAG
jgi:hypothetical protein